MKQYIDPPLLREELGCNQGVRRKSPSQGAGMLVESLDYKGSKAHEISSPGCPFPEYSSGFPIDGCESCKDFLMGTALLALGMLL